jgi:hypothetical protein
MAATAASAMPPRILISAPSSERRLYLASRTPYLDRDFLRSPTPMAS